MLVIYTSQQSSSANDVQGARAYQAAKAGIEFETYQILTKENGTAIVAPYNCPASPDTPAFAGALQGYAISVSCVLTSTTEGSNTIRVYQLTSTASKGAAGANDYVERRLTASVATCRIGPGTVAPCS
jgi:MSHA biogenesis protein MshP